MAALFLSEFYQFLFFLTPPVKSHKKENVFLSNLTFFVET